MLVVEVPDGLVHKAGGLGRVADRRPSHIDFRHKVHVAAAFAVGGLAPIGVTVVVVGAVETGKVDVARHGGFVLFAGRDNHVQVLGGNDVIISTNDDILDAITVIPVSDVVAHVIGIAASNISSGTNLCWDAVGVVVVLQRHKGAGERRGGENQQLVTPLAAYSRRRIRTDSLRVVNLGTNLHLVFHQAPEKRQRPVRINRVHHHRQTGIVVKLSGSWNVLDRLKFQRQDLITTETMRANLRKRSAGKGAGRRVDGGVRGWWGSRPGTGRQSHRA